MENILYIPGLGGENLLNYQRKYVNSLSLVSRKRIFFFDPKWESDKEEDAESKYDRLNGFIESIGGAKTVVGISAGATLATRLALDKHDTTEAHLICGKVHTARTVTGEFHERSPALHDSVAATDELLAIAQNTGQNLSELTCYIPRNTDFDGAIHVDHMTFDGASEVYLPNWRHDRAIFYALVKYLPGIAHGK